MPPDIDPHADIEALVRISFEMRVIQHHLQRLAALRGDLTYVQRLWFGEVLRDIADEIDRGERLGECLVRE